MNSQTNGGCNWNVWAMDVRLSGAVFQGGALNGSMGHLRSQPLNLEASTVMSSGNDVWIIQRVERILLHHGQS